MRASRRPGFVAMGVLLCLVAGAAACRSVPPGPRPRQVTGPPLELTLATGKWRYLLEVVVDDATARAVVELGLARDREEYLAELRIVEVRESAHTVGAAAALASLGGIVYRFRLSREGNVLPGGGPAGIGTTPAASLALAVRLWPLLAGAFPSLPASPVREGESWRSASVSEIVGRDLERQVRIEADWQLAKVLKTQPRTAILEGQYEVVVLEVEPATVGARSGSAREREPGREVAMAPAGGERRLGLATEDLEAQPAAPDAEGPDDTPRPPSPPLESFRAESVIYLDLEAQRIDFASVVSPSGRWQMRRLD